MADTPAVNPEKASPLLDFLKGGTFRRLCAAAASVLVPIANSKLNLGLSETTVAEMLGGLALYIGQSLANEMHARHVEAKTSAQAAAVFNQAGK